jgi:transcriptional regulator with XRE-family HTH domain
MRLGQYMAGRGVNDAALARDLGVTAAAVGRYRNGKRLPSPAVMKKIRRLTDGAVTADDFYPDETDG